MRITRAGPPLPWAISLCLAFLLGRLSSPSSPLSDLGDASRRPSRREEGEAEAGTTTVGAVGDGEGGGAGVAGGASGSRVGAPNGDAPASSSPRDDARRRLLDLPPAVEYAYINVGTSWDPWPGCGTKGLPNEIKTGHNNVGGGLPYDPSVFCIYVEPLTRVNAALHERGLITNSSMLIHAAVGPTKGLAPFYEYAGVSGVASSLSTISDEILRKEVKAGGKGPFSSGARGQSFTTVVTLKDVLDIIPDRVRILQMKTDMQGFDVSALASGGEDVRRIDEIYHECYGDGEAVEYEGAPIDNTFREAKALLEPMGFEAGLSRNHDCNWRRRGVTRVEGRRYLGSFP